MSSRLQSIRSGFVVLGDRGMVGMGDEWLTQEAPIPDTFGLMYQVRPELSTKRGVPLYKHHHRATSQSPCFSNLTEAIDDMATSTNTTRIVGIIICPSMQTSSPQASL